MHRTIPLEHPRAAASLSRSWSLLAGRASAKDSRSSHAEIDGSGSKFEEVFISEAKKGQTSSMFRTCKLVRRGVRAADLHCSFFGATPVPY